MKLSKIKTLERIIGRLDALAITELDDKKSKIIANAVAELIIYMCELYQTESIENDLRGDKTSGEHSMEQEG